MLILSQIQVKIIARDSLEEIAQLSLTIREIEKVEIVFEERTVLNIYGKNKISIIFFNWKSFRIRDFRGDTTDSTIYQPKVIFPY